jgi:hypothetical protein
MKRVIARSITTVLLTVICTALLLGCAEFFLRWYYRDVLSTADGLSYFAQHSVHLFVDELNRFRLRGRDFPENHDGRYRIVVQGDSFTYGGGVYPVDAIFTEILSEKLQTDDYKKGALVINAGVSGHNLRNHIKYFKHFVKNIHPDFVLYQWYINDVDNSPNYKTITTPRLISNRAVHTFLWKNSALYYLIQNRYGMIRRMTGKQLSYTEYLRGRFLDPESPDSRKADKLTNKLFDSYEKAGVDYGVVLFPTFSDDLSNYQLGFLHDRVLEICTDRGIKCLDLRDTYKGLPNKSLWANAFDAHPGKKAHKMAADAIYDFFDGYWKQQADSSASGGAVTETSTTQ